MFKFLSSWSTGHIKKPLLTPSTYEEITDSIPQRSDEYGAASVKEN